MIASALVRSFLFLSFSFLQITYAEAAKDAFAIPAEDPNECVKVQLKPCSLTTGDQPRLFHWDGNQWEFDRHSTAQVGENGLWNFYKGMVVIQSKKELKVHTPFVDILLGNSKVMIHVIENKVRVMSLMGEGIRVYPRQSKEEQFLVPGFQNWYGGVGPEGQDYGVVSVIDFKQFAKDRSAFFMDHKLGFVKELNQMASIVKTAAVMASQMHRDLVDRKIASLEEKHQQKVMRHKRNIIYDKYLRKLFLQKIRYDY